MTLDTFNLMDYSGKLNLVLEYGKHIQQHIPSFGELEICQLYSVENFYVELVYNLTSNKVREVRSFISGEHLKKYFVQDHILKYKLRMKYDK